MEETKLSPKTLAEQEAGRKAVERRAMLDASARATQAEADKAEQAEQVEIPTKASKKKS